MCGFKFECWSKISDKSTKIAMDEGQQAQEAAKTELKKMHRIIGRIVATLAGAEGVSNQVLDEGNALLTIVSEALALNTAGRSINQSRHEPAGCCWWDGRLGSWFCRVLRVSLDLDERFDGLRALIKKVDLNTMDRLADIGRSEEMMSREQGPARVIKLGFIPVQRRARLTDDEKLGCPVEGCEAKFSSDKAYHSHLKDKHSAEEAER